MVYRRSSYAEQTAPDTGWGLIYRLNIIMNKIEEAVIRGDYIIWNLHLDSLFRNMMFIDAKTKKYWPEMVKYRVQIDAINNKIIEARVKEDPKIKIYINEIWSVLYKKDIWLRGVMYDLNLYLKKPEFDLSKRQIYDT